MWSLWHDEKPSALTVLLFHCSSAPSPLRNELPSAENSGSDSTSPTVERGTHVKVTANEVDIVLLHVPMKPLK